VSETVGLVPTRTPLVIRLLPLDSVIAVENQVRNYGYVQHVLEALDLRIDFFIVFRQVGCELIDEHP
jgi:hypothetical protein